jgi:RNA polymerase sigma-70 factor (ECF subfamily)
MDECVKNSDSELLALAAAGDQKAFAELVGRYRDKVFGLAYRYVRDRQDAEELAQEIFLKVWRHARTFKGRSAFATWLYRLAVNTCLNYRQKKKSVPEALPLIGDLAATAPAAGEEIMSRERKKMLDQALDVLPARQKMALILASFEGKSYEEIASLMEVSLSAVETLLFRSRQNLGRILGPLKKKGEL